MATIEIDMSEFKAFFQRMEKAAQGDFRREFEIFLEGLGEEFLRLVQDEFINRNKNTGYGQLINSFTKSAEGAIWRYEDDGLTLEVGSSLKYAGYVNDGHRTLDPAKKRYFTLANGEMARYVPGRWQGNRFIFDPSAKEGMVLKYHWVEGLHFWEAAFHAMERLCPAILEAKLQAWMNKYFE